MCQLFSSLCSGQALPACRGSCPAGSSPRVPYLPWLQKAYAKANSLAVQNVSNVRTVVSYNAEDAAVEAYNKELDEPSRVAKFSGAFSGGFTGLVNGFFFASYALALW